ncbi:hypothetical protein PNK_0852 [Candidatus Protochlamydia naegleriophila]|uniref:Uncharacterized protein n=1 Tax=Candidatus Protochlamydia naegleriophila TaxID=389348 RepID=A0A0U5JBJ6_9BACT|nr:hypothetical protein [Candidatus Protochlamydia naegleriophila]CUI16477.1 hypothetical protein PNK_0852 [Candidatus Protochlamydia naegleriophila]
MIDTSVRPIGINPDFVPPQPESVLSSKSLAFILLNAMTFGVYGSIEILSKQHKIAALNFNGDILQQKAHALNQSWEELENNLREVSAHVNESLTNPEADDQNIQSTLNAIEGRNNYNRTRLSNLNERLESSVARVALDCIAFFGQLFVNVITLGLYGAYQNCALKNQIELITAENGYIIGQINLLKDTKGGAIDMQVAQLRGMLASERELKEIRQINLEETRASITRLNQQVEALQLETRELSNQFTAAKTTDVQLRKAVQDLETLLNGHNRELRNLNEEHERLTRSGNTQGTEARRLQGQIAACQRDIELAKAAADRVALIQKEVSQRKFIQSNWGEIQRTQKNLGPIAPKYEKRAEDGELAGAYGLVMGEDDDDLMSDYAKRYNDKKTAVELVQAGFKFAFDDLLAKAQETDAYITFNKSSKIHQNVKYLPQKKAVFRRIVWDFVENARLQQVDCHGYGLNLNNNDILMRASNPVRVQTYRDTGDGRELQLRVLLTQTGDFSPPMEDRDLRYGIDPPSAKWIFEQLSEEEKKHLFNLLMEPLIANNTQQLVDLQVFLGQVDNKRVELVRTACDLICDMALALEKNFEDKGLLTELWSEKANAEDLLPLEKEQMLINDSREPVYVQWTPNMDLLFGGEVDLNRQLFVQNFFEAQLQYQTVFQFMTPDLLLKPLAIDDDESWDNPVRWNTRIVNNAWESSAMRYGISHQYHGSSFASGSMQDTLFGSLLTVLMGQRDSISEQMVVQLRKLVAASLDNPDTARKFADRIRQTHTIVRRGTNGIFGREGMTVEEYQKALAEDRLDKSNYGQIEIELTALAFGVRIGVFVAGQETKIDENGLLVPADKERYFGPHTQETLLLYNKSGSTYYGLFPKLKSPEMGHEAYDAIQQLRQYWSSREIVDRD